MNPKHCVPVFLIWLFLPSLLFAQNNGGDGRGDISYGIGSNPLNTGMAMYKGGNGQGYAYAFSANIPLNAGMAMYKGSNGRGDIMSGIIGSPVNAATAMYKGANGRGDIVFFLSGNPLNTSTAMYKGGNGRGDWVIDLEGNPLNTATAMYKGADGKGDIAFYLGNLMFQAPRQSFVKLFLEGLFNAFTQSMIASRNASGYQFADTIADQVTLLLANPAAPYSIAQTFTLPLLTNGNLNFAVPYATNGNYYIVVRHRNHLETWSAAPIPFTPDNPVNYDFTLSASKAFGNNLKPMPGNKYALYCGDTNADGTIDTLDMAAISLSASSFQTGYVNTDLNGDGIVDALDLILIDNNIAKFIHLIRP